MRVLILGRSSNAGGGPKWGLTLARGLYSRGHSVRIVFTRIGERKNFLHREASEDGFVYEPLCYQYGYPTYPRDLAAFIDSWGPDVVLIDNHERIQEAFPQSLRLTNRATKVVFIAHCQDTPHSYLEAIRPMLWKVICVSQRSADAMPQFNPTVIRNGVYPPPANGEDIRNTLGVPNDAFVFGYVGRHDQNKASGHLYRALEGTDWWLLLGGKNAPQPPPELEASAKDRVRVWPHEIEAIGDWYKAMDVFVLPSRNEGFPLCISEAFTSGCRVASTRVSDLEAVFGPAIAFFDYGDIRGMKRAIAEAPDGEEGRRIATEELSVERMIDQYEETLSDGR